jgi:hypothetical protein
MIGPPTTGRVITISILDSCRTKNVRYRDLKMGSMSRRDAVPLSVTEVPGFLNPNLPPESTIATDNIVLTASTWLQERPHSAGGSAARFSMIA